MTDFLGTLSLGVIFRHFVSGGVFVFAFLQSTYGLTPELLRRMENHAGGLAVVALLSGVVIYAIHRGTTNPLLELLRHRLYLCEGKFARRCRCMPESVLQMLVARWKNSGETKKAGDHIFEWGDYVHLLYTCAFGAWGGSLLAFFVADDGCKWVCNPLVLCLGSVLLVSGLVTDIRKHVVERRLWPSE